MILWSRFKDYLRNTSSRAALTADPRCPVRRASRAQTAAMFRQLVAQVELERAIAAKVKA